MIKSQKEETSTKKLSFDKIETCGRTGKLTKLIYLTLEHFEYLKYLPS